MSWVAAGLAIGSFAMDIMAADKKDKAEKSSSKKTEKQLAALFETTKKQLSFQRDIELRALDRTGKAIHGQQRAGYAASGVKVDTGTPLKIAIDTSSEIAMDRSIIRQRYDLEVDAALKRSKAGMPQTPPSTLGPTALQSGLTLLTKAEKSDYWGLLK